MISDVIEVHCSGLLLEELDALYSNLIVSLIATLLELEDAIFLIWLVLLCQDDLLEIDGLGIA